MGFSLWRKAVGLMASKIHLYDVIVQIAMCSVNYSLLQFYFIFLDKLFNLLSKTWFIVLLFVFL